MSSANIKFAFCIIIFAQALNAKNSSVKYLDQALTRIEQRPNYFSPDDISSNKFIEIKSQEWSACHQKPSPAPFLEAKSKDNVRNFLDGTIPFDHLDKMESENLMAGQAKQQPWSGDYWAISRGLLGNRYLDTEFLSIYEWSAKHKFIQDNSVTSILEKSGQEGVTKLSPSEKYDLIVGDNSNGLTNIMWAEGQKYVDQSGNVEGWMGICHGWAPASIVEPRPKHAVDVFSFDQKWKIHLVPSEIKGLTSFSWASNNFDTEFLGQRCNKKDPKRDANGRLTDPECFDLNPATWHVAIVNQMGRKGKSFVLDATYDYQVWNQPALQYSYTYFNVQTGAPVKTLAEALVEKNAFTSDKYKKYRAPEATTFVGITMKLAYVVETSADSDETDEEKNDIINWVQYDYDLELDKNGKIIGGEWHQTIHPDFIWTPKENVKPTAPLDNLISLNQWDTSADINKIPQSWSETAIESAKQGFILNTITEAIVEQANQ